MKVEKTKGGRYEAITNIKGFGIDLINNVYIPAQVCGYGSTHSEAIKRCLDKVDRFISKDNK